MPTIAIDSNTPTIAITPIEMPTIAINSNKPTIAIHPINTPSRLINPIMELLYLPKYTTKTPLTHLTSFSILVLYRVTMYEGRK